LKIPSQKYEYLLKNRKKSFILECVHIILPMYYGFLPKPINNTTNMTLNTSSRSPHPSNKVNFKVDFQIKTLCISNLDIQKFHFIEKSQIFRQLLHSKFWVIIKVRFQIVFPIRIRLY